MPQMPAQRPPSLQLTLELWRPWRARRSKGKRAEVGDAPTLRAKHANLCAMCANQ
jgi:hypothetical protein